MPLDWCGFQGSVLDVSTLTGVVARVGWVFLATELSCQADTPENENGVALVLVAWERGWSVIGVSNPSQSLIRTPGAPRIVADGRGPCGPRPDQHA